MPAAKVTSVMWGGNLLDTMYVTTSRHDSTAEQVAAQPKSGAVFAVKGLGARGLPANKFSSNTRHDC